MSGESTSSDLVELVRRAAAATKGGDVDATMSFYAPDAVSDMSSAGMGTFEGRAAIRGFSEDWFSAYDYEEFEMRTEEILDLGNGVTLAVVIQKGRPVGSSGDVGLRSATVGVWVDGRVVEATNCTDIGQARADAERLAESRG
jgi:ketosteroid isomerase-like protein